MVDRPSPEWTSRQLTSGIPPIPWRDFRSPTDPPDCSDVARRIGGTITDLKKFLERAIARSQFPSTGC